MQRFISILFCSLTANCCGMSRSGSYSSEILYSDGASSSEADSSLSPRSSSSLSSINSPDVSGDLEKLVVEATKRSSARLGQPEQALLTQPLRRKDPCGKIEWTKQDARWSPLHRLATQSEKSSTLRTLLATNRFAVDAFDANGWTPLMLAVFSGNFAGVNMLLRHGACADIYAHRLTGRNRAALVTLLSRGHQSVTSCCEVGSKCDNLCPLILAAREGFTRMIPQLLEGSLIGPNQANCNGETALLHAVDAGKFDTVKELVETHGARRSLFASARIPKKCNPSKKERVTVLDLAVKHPEIFCYLAGKVSEEVREDFSRKVRNFRARDHLRRPFIFTAVHSVPLMEMLMIRFSCDVNGLDDDCGTLLMEACRQGAPVESLGFIACKLRNGIQDANLDGSTPLMAAAEGGYEHAVKWLCDTGAYLNEQDENGLTALMVAALNDREGVVRILLNAGADKTVEDEDGLPAWWFAKSGSAIEELLE